MPEWLWSGLTLTGQVCFREAVMLQVGEGDSRVDMAWEDLWQHCFGKSRAVVWREEHCMFCERPTSMGVDVHGSDPMRDRIGKKKSP